MTNPIFILVLMPSVAPADTLDQLMAQLKALPGMEAEFAETKHITLLAAPLGSTGVLRFSPEGALQRETLTPTPSKVLIVKDRLYFDDGKKKQEVDVGGNPVVRAFVNSFVLLLTGDKKGLESLFTMKFLPGQGTEPWTLDLIPKKAPISNVIKKMQVEGRGVELRKLTIVEGTGDRSETTFHKVNTARRFSSDERKKYFGGH